MDTYDLVVVGTGPGGSAAAFRSAQLGLRVASIDRGPAPGGVCLQVGCIPSKALLDSSQRYAAVRQTLDKHGIRVQGVELDLPAMMRRKERTVQRLTQGIELLLRKNRIATFFGDATIPAPNTVQVEGPEGGTQLGAERILVATGSRPASLPGVAFDGTRILSSTEALSLNEVPNTLAVVGAGYIGLELGSVWNRLGTEVTIVEAGNQILPGMDPDLTAEAQKLFSRQGLKFKLGSAVKSVTRDEGGCIVVTDTGESLAAEKVLVAIGRTPSTDDLGLERIGVARHPDGTVQVDDRFATNVPGVFALGDVVGGKMLAHKAEEEGIAFAESLHGDPPSVNYDAVPEVVFTDPEIAAVGKTETWLTEQGIAYERAAYPFRATGRARTAELPNGFVKLLVDRTTRKILGCQILGAQAGELINEAALALKLGLKDSELAQSCHAHPTFGETLREAALTSCARNIHA